jgi:hypothetical protein
MRFTVVIGLNFSDTFSEYLKWPLDEPKKKPKQE